MKISRNVVSRISNRVIETLAVVSALSIAFAPAPSFAQTAPPQSAISTMVSDLDDLADDAMPIAVGVTGFGIGALLIKRVLYA